MLETVRPNIHRSATTTSDISDVIAPAMTVSVIVPTRNEAGNIKPLVSLLRSALNGFSSEVIFVDDSDDRTPEVIADVAHERSGPPVRLLHRTPGHRVGGLGGAVQAGLRIASSQLVVVMDGDLQHPPELIPSLVGKLVHDKLDLVVASRYVDGGASTGLSSAARQFVSAGATKLARLLFPRLLAQVADPMSGFFAFRREIVDPARLRPDGFKILLEILARVGSCRAGEVPFSFGERHDGESKASGKEGVRYARQLMRLRLVSSGAWLMAFSRFAIVGTSGVFVNLTLLQVLLVTGVAGPIAACLAAQASIVSNFALTERWVFSTSSSSVAWWRRAIPFWLLNSATVLVQLPLVAGLVWGSGISYLVATGIVLSLLVLIRFLTLDRLVYRVRDAATLASLSGGMA